MRMHVDCHAQRPQRHAQCDTCRSGGRDMTPAMKAWQQAVYDKHKKEGAAHRLAQGSHPMPQRANVDTVGQAAALHPHIAWPGAPGAGWPGAMLNFNRGSERFRATKPTLEDMDDWRYWSAGQNCWKRVQADHPVLFGRSEPSAAERYIASSPVAASVIIVAEEFGNKARAEMNSLTS